MRSINLIVIHCSATPNGRPVTVEEVTAWHQARGFKTIGYHYLIGIDGTVNMGRPEEEMGAHAQGFNANSIGIALVGGTGGQDKHNPGMYSQAQWDALQTLVQDLQSRYPGSGVCGHRDLSPDLNGDGIVEPDEWIKLCPSFEVSAWTAGGMAALEAQILHG
jgi:N-acetyl-anhydromuramyl-L-alanine amidase AmpD